MGAHRQITVDDWLFVFADAYQRRHLSGKSA